MISRSEDKLLDVADEIGKEDLPSLINDPYKTTRWNRNTYQIDSLDRQKMHSGWWYLACYWSHLCLNLHQILWQYGTVKQFDELLISRRQYMYWILHIGIYLRFFVFLGGGLCYLVLFYSIIYLWSWNNNYIIIQ